MQILRWMVRRWSWLVVMGMLLAGCGSGPGKHGHVFGMMTKDASIASVNVKNLGFPTTPTVFDTYQLKTGSRRINWTTAGAVNYEADLDFEPHPGKDETEVCILVVFCTEKQGADGADRTFLLEFSGSNVTISEVASVTPGTQY